MHVGISRDFLSSGGDNLIDPEALAALAAQPGLTTEFLDSPAMAPIVPDDLRRFDALLIKRNPVDASLFAAVPAPALRLRLIARNGVGYDHIAIDACQQAGVVVAITPDAVARPVASSIMALMLAFSHRLLPRDHAARAGRWSERWNQAGMALTGRTLGVVGLGNIGCELLRLAEPWGMQHLAHTPRPDPARHAGLRVSFVSLDALLRRSDVLALCCPLTAQTCRLIDAQAIARMPHHALLINTARGELVDEIALVDALRSGRIAGAGIDVYDTEPPDTSHPFFALDNVILGSHNLAFTDEMNARSNRSAVQAICRMASGSQPAFVVNPGALADPRHAGLRA